MEVTSVWGTLWTSYKYLKEVNKQTDLGPAARDSVNDLWQLKLSSAFHFFISPEESKAAWRKDQGRERSANSPPCPFQAKLEERLEVDVPGGSLAKNLPAMQETQVWSLGLEDPLEKNVDQCQLQALQFSVHLIDLLSVLLRCNGFAVIRKL